MHMYSEFYIGLSPFVMPGAAREFIPPKSMRTPTLMLLGIYDTIVLPEKTHALSVHFLRSCVRVEVHDGGK